MRSPANPNSALAQAAKIPGSWVQSLLPGETTAGTLPLASYPNLNLLEHPATNVASIVSPGYVAQPAPLGIADYGLGTTPYTYSPSHFLGSVVFEDPPNVTDPASQSVVDPGGENLGYVGSPYEFGIQLNTIMTNVSLPGLVNGTFWTQNVVNFNDTAIHFVQDIFNFSYDSHYYITPETTILSGCGLTDLVPMLTVYGGVYQCVGANVAISPADFPMTINLYNNATINAQNETQLVFGAQVTGPGGTIVSGPIDTVIFNNPAAPGHAPPNPVGFTVSGTTPSPVGLLFDAELDLVGSIGGDNSVFSSLSGSLQLDYTNSSSGGWQTVPSAYNFGSDTGETSTGITGYWDARGTEDINQGPSFLYGLWGSIPYVSVPTGSIDVYGSIDPDYGFVFISNTPANATGGNFSWIPTNAAGDFDSYLPPSIPPSTEYYVQSFADGYQERNTTPFSGNQEPYPTITLNTSMSLAHTLNAPLYMDGNAQALALSTVVSGVTSAYSFSDLVVNLNYTFNHLNDYGYPSFGIFRAVDVNALSLLVNDLSQGQDSPLGNFYVWDGPYPGVSGLLTPPWLIPTSLLNYSQQIDVYLSSPASPHSVTISDETLTGNTAVGSPQGGSVFLWKDDGPLVEHTVVQAGPHGYDFGGVFVGDSIGTTVWGLNVSGGSNGVDDVGSTGTYVNYDNSTGLGSFGIYALSSTDGEYADITAVSESTGVYAGGYTGYAYYEIPGFTDTEILDVSASMGTETTATVGVEFFYSDDVYIATVTAEDNGTGVVALISEDFEVDDLTTNNPAAVFGSVFELDIDGYVENVGQYGAGPSVLFFDDELMEGEYTFTTGGVTFYVVYCFAVFLYDGTNAYVDEAIGYGYFGIYLEDFDDSFVVDTYAIDDGIGAFITDSLDDTVVNTTALYYSQGVWLCGSDTEEECSDNADISVTNTSASNESVGVVVWGDTFLSTVTNVFATNQSVGIFAYEAEYDTFSDIVATNQTLGVPAIEVFDYYMVIDTVVEEDLPIAAVVTGYTSDISIENVQATTYPFALYDEGSGEPDAAPAPAGLYVENLNLTDGGVAVALYETYYSLFVGIEAYQDLWGVYTEYDEFNVFTQSTFLDSSSYGVALFYSYEDLVWDNNFIGNNGATTVYSAAHIQAFDQGTDDAWYYCAPSGICTGNYWADWHTYGPNGQLAPYLIAGNTYDLYPIGFPEAEYSVTFSETGLASGTTWSATLNGVTQSSTATTIVFGELPGSYAFSVSVPTGYSATPSSGTVDVTTSDQTVNVAFTATYTVSLTETGLPTGTSWSAVFNGIMASSTTATISYTASAGTYSYSVLPIAGYTVAPSSGTVTISGTVGIPVTFSAVPTYAVTLTETGLPTGTSWTAVFDGMTGTSTTATITFNVPAGTYSYQVVPVSGYTASPTSGSATVGGDYDIAVAFTEVKYAVTVSESGLATGTSWSATVNGVTQSSVGSEITFYLPNGTYTYSVATVSGYTLTGATGSIVVNGSAAGAAVAFTPSTTPSVVSSSTFNTGFAVAVAIAVIALLIGLIALFGRRRKPAAENPPPPTAWTPPSGSAAPPPSGGTGSSGSWQESSDSNR